MALRNLDQFRAKVRSTQLARTERFEVTFNFNQVTGLSIPGVDNDALNEEVILMCEEVQIPGMVVANKEVNLGNWTHYRNANVGFLGNEINFTFITGTDWNLRRAFEEWINKCVDTTSKQIGFPDDVHMDITVKSLDIQDGESAYWTLKECTPKVLNLIPLSQGTVSIVRNTLIISAAYWESDTIKVGLGRQTPVETILV